MIWTIAIIVALVWTLGYVTAYTLGGLLHVLIVVTAALILVGIIRAATHVERRKPLPRSRSRSRPRSRPEPIR